MTQHTKGPWTIGEVAEAEDCAGIDLVPFIEICRDIEAPHPDYKTVCNVASSMDENDNFYISEEDRANARLIAAAPDLLEAVKRVRTWATDNGYPADHPLFTDTESAITKAIPVS